MAWANLPKNRLRLINKRNKFKTKKPAGNVMVTALVFHKCMTEYPQKGQRINAECYAKLKKSLKEKW